MKQFVLKIGSFKTIILITLFSILVSVTVVFLLSWLFPSLKPSIVAALVAAIIALLVAVPMVNLLFQVSALEKEMRALATYDELTKLLNRRSFLERAEYACHLARREKQNFAILIADLDWFKLINDQYGHAAGDEVLALLGQVISQISRASDIAGRIGGEEFAFFLPNTNLEAADNFANRLHHAISEVSVDYKGVPIHFTISIGLAEFTGQNPSQLVALMQLADEALYEAKRAGRNQTVKVLGS
ncbi:MAG: GGDEF domain-containing protein [Methylophilaceae bacterium]